jgi:uncharacterized protein (TIRG00374 family)
VLKLILLALGVLALIGLVWHVGPAQILTAVTHLGPGAILVILLPSLLMYVIEAYGWRLTMGAYADRVPFVNLLAIRTAGEVVNMTTPTAYVGGEPLKAYLLKRHGVPLVDGMASAITAKTTMTLGEVLFILLGIALLAVTMSGENPPSMAGKETSHSLGAALGGVSCLLIGTLLLLAMQRRGLFTGFLNLLRRCRIRLAYLESREEKLRALDQAIQEFYTRDRRAFLLSIGMFVLGWLCEALEVYAILYYVGPPVDAVASISIAALAAIIKGGSFIIPGSVGAQEGGNVLLLMAYGYSDLAGITFAVLRRVRELVWIIIGLACLAALGGFRRQLSDAAVRSGGLRKP